MKYIAKYKIILIIVGAIFLLFLLRTNFVRDLFSKILFPDKIKVVSSSLQIEDIRSLSEIYFAEYYGDVLCGKNLKEEKVDEKLLVIKQDLIKYCDLIRDKLEKIIKRDPDIDRAIAIILNANRFRNIRMSDYFPQLDVITKTGKTSDAILRIYNNDIRGIEEFLLLKKSELLARHKKRILLLGSGQVVSGFSLNEINIEENKNDSIEFIIIKGLVPKILFAKINPGKDQNGMGGYQVLEEVNDFTFQDLSEIDENCINQLISDAISQQIKLKTMYNMVDYLNDLYIKSGAINKEKFNYLLINYDILEILREAMFIDRKIEAGELIKLKEFYHNQQKESFIKFSGLEGSIVDRNRVLKNFINEVKDSLIINGQLELFENSGLGSIE